MILSKKAKDHTGKTYGRLKVLSPVGYSKSGNYIVWKCQCDCGNETEVKSGHLVSGATRSCGCLARELSSKRIKNIHETGQHLYFIRCHDFVKIGRTNNIEQRLSQLQSMNPFKITLEKVFDNQGYREKEFHDKYKDYHIQGEWFLLKEDIVRDL